MEIRIKDLIIDKISGEWGDPPSDDNSINIIRTTNFTNIGKIDFSNLVLRKIDKKKIDYKRLHKGDIIIEKSGGSPTQPVGRVVYFDKDENEIYLCNNFTTILRPDTTKINSKYFFYQLFIGYMRGKTLKYQNKTTGIINLKLDKYLDEKILVPSIHDQMRIVTVLSKVETLIKQRKDSIDLLDEFLKTTFLKMFGNYNKMSKSKLDVLGNNISYLTSGSRGWAKYYSNKGAKFLRIQNIGEGSIRTDNIVYVTPPISAESERTRVEEGDLIISITADLGRASVVPKGFGEAYINQHLALIRLNKNILPIYAAYFYNLPFGNNSIQKKNRSSVKAGLNFNDIKSFPIFIPSIKSQKQFVTIVEKAEILKSHFKESLIELENLLGSLSRKAFKGELNLSTLRVLAEEEEYRNYTNDRTELDHFPEPKLVVEFPKTSIQTTLTAQMRKFIEKANSLQEIFPTPQTITGSSNIIKLAKQIEQINKLMATFEKLPKIPASVSQAMKTFESIKSISFTLQESKKKESSRITWEQVNFQQVSNWIKNKYDGFHFNSEMLIRFLTEEHLTFPNYYSSEELKTNPKLSEGDDLKSYMFSAFNNENPFIKLEQVFYDASKENIELKLHEEDYELIKDKEKSERSGVYFKIIE